jgi:predicted nucleic acid-binding protein
VITAVDSSVLLAIGKGEDSSATWAEFLQKQAGLGRLIACEVVVAETAALFDDPNDIAGYLHDLKVEYEPIEISAATLAGSIFKSYRRAGGPREHLIPDFLIGAHAMRQGDQLAAADRGYLRRYFPALKVIAPK